MIDALVRGYSRRSWRMNIRDAVRIFNRNVRFRGQMDYCDSSTFSFGQRRSAVLAKPSGWAAKAVRLVSLANR